MNSSIKIFLILLASAINTFAQVSLKTAPKKPDDPFKMSEQLKRKGPQNKYEKMMEDFKRPVPSCVHETESSYESLTEKALGGNTVANQIFGNNEKCLKAKGVSPEEYVRASDLNRYHENCGEFKLQNQFQDLNQITTQAKLNNRDFQVNAFFQDLAMRSHSQIACRIKTLNQISFSPENRNKLISKASSRFDEIVKNVQALIISKNEAGDALDRDLQKNILTFTPEASLGKQNTIIKERKRVELPFEKAISEEIAKLPFGYEPEVVRAILNMVEGGKFNQALYERSIEEVTSKYYKFSKYYDDNIIGYDDNFKNNYSDIFMESKSQGYGWYCISRDYKIFASQSGVVDQLLEKYPDKAMSPTVKAIIKCHLSSKYDKAKKRSDAAKSGFFMVGTMAASAAASAPTAGASMAFWGSAVAMGLSGADLADSVLEAYKECHKPEFMISPDGAEVCEAEKEFLKAVQEFSPASCAGQTALAAISAIGFVKDVKDFVDKIPDGTSLSEIINKRAESQEIVVTGSMKATGAPPQAVPKPNVNVDVKINMPPAPVNNGN